MTVLSVAQQASTVLGLSLPTVLFSSTTQTSVEIQNMMNFCVQQILEGYDWQRLKKIATITGDGVTEDFDMPADYDRMVRDAHLWSTAMPFWNAQQIQSVDEWLAIEATGFVSLVNPIWIIFGNQFHIKWPIGNGETLRYFYISNLMVQSSGSTTGDKPLFTEDTDTLVISETLLRYCFIYNWKMAKGFNYAAELQQFTEEFGYIVGKDHGPRVIREGRNNRLWPGFGAPWPYGGNW